MPFSATRVPRYGEESIVVRRFTTRVPVLGLPLHLTGSVVATLKGATFGPGVPVPLRLIRCVSVDSYAETLAFNAGRDDAQGSEAPSLYMERGGSLRLRIPVDPGSRSLSIKCRQTADWVPRAYARVLRNDEVGVLTDQVATAPLGSGWVTIGPITFTATQRGGVFFELVAPEGECWFDTLTLV